MKFLQRQVHLDFQLYLWIPDIAVQPLSGFLNPSCPGNIAYKPAEPIYDSRTPPR